MSVTPNDRVVNTMTVDVEDYFHVSAFEGTVDRTRWDAMESRVEANTYRILELFAEHEVRATFFVLGWVAQRYKRLVRELVRQGHEVASHGYAHHRVTTQSLIEFDQDIRRAKSLLEDITGQSVQGYRAPSYSIGKQTLWALDALLEAGYRYSSSVYPVRHDLYGLPDAPRFPFRWENGLLEIPITTVRLGGHNLPFGGGGFFRLYPYWISRWGIHRNNSAGQQPCIFYFHPWELDPEQPRVGNLGLKSRIRHYLNLHRTGSRLRRLLSDFQWGRLDEVMLQPPIERFRGSEFRGVSI